MSRRRMCNATSVFEYTDCQGPVPEDAPVSLCNVHLRKVYAYVKSSLDEVGPFVFANGAEIQLTPDPKFPPVVYYIRNQERIKIGWTGDLDQRLRGLHYDEVLAIEPGDGRLEMLRHEQFKADRVTRRGEWFRISPELLSHVEMIRDHFPDQQYRGGVAA